MREDRQEPHGVRLESKTSMSAYILTITCLYPLSRPVESAKQQRSHLVTISQYHSALKGSRAPWTKYEICLKHGGVPTIIKCSKNMMETQKSQIQGNLSIKINSTSRQ